MQMGIVSYSYGVERLELVQHDWVFGLLSEATALHTPLAPRANIAKAIRGSIRASKRTHERGLQVFSVYLAPLMSTRGFIRKVPDDCLPEFLSINPGDVDSVKAFLRRYGLFDLAHLYALPRHQPRAIRQLWAAAEKQEQIPFAFDLSEFWADCVKFDELQSLWAFIQNGTKGFDATAISSLCKGIGEDYILNFDPGQYRFRDAMRYAVRAAISAECQEVAVILNEDRGGLIPYLATSCVKDALYLQLLSKVAAKTPLCRCQRCGRAFVAIRKTKRYCNEKCQNMAKRYRQLGKPSDYHAQRE
jgi:hypothetical protein